MAPVRKLTRAEQARQYLAGGAVLREDSDDELGLEDHPWEWLYEDNDETQTTQDATPRKRKAVAAAPSRRIAGARMGNFVCKQGDTVLLKADGNQAWVGIICEFFEDELEDEKMAKFMWFSSEKEIRNKSTKRTDFLPVRLPRIELWVHKLMHNRTNCIFRPPTMRTPLPPSTVPLESCRSRSSSDCIRRVR